MASISSGDVRNRRHLPVVEAASCTRRTDEGGVEVVDCGWPDGQPPESASDPSVDAHLKEKGLEVDLFFENGASVHLPE